MLSTKLLQYVRQTPAGGRKYEPLKKKKKKKKVNLSNWEATSISLKKT